MKYLTTREVAKDTGLTIRAIQKYIKEGFLPANFTYQGNLKVYQIEPREYIEWKNKYFLGIKRGEIKKSSRCNKPLNKEETQEQINQWLTALGDGTFNGKVYSPRTIEIYQYAMGRYLKLIGTNPCKPLISKDHLKNIYSSLSVAMYATKQKIYDALICFSKFLLEKEHLTECELKEISNFKPKRYFPPQKITLSEKEINYILEAIKTMKGNSEYDKLLTKTLIILLKETGLRASELCNLKKKDVNLSESQIYIWNGKGNKHRRVGITEECKAILLDYVRENKFQNSSEYFFNNKNGKVLNRNTLRLKWSRLSKRLGFKITSHAFRRAFVTLNVNKGKPLVHLQIAAGHSDIKTTRGYCMTSQDEVVEAMRGW
ncbi:MAG: tyrosine-type recombinase/integrase [Candidatus Caenarcaniphilales bacterium]|nr:tyrosine-type recombinase/integrase [Candidatus Caenarcaniphilales bacterium]